MKLTKLLLLAPAFAMLIGCKSTPVESSEEVDTHTVTEQTWKEQIYYAEFIKPGQNKTIKVSAERGTEYAAYYTFKQDGNKYEASSSKRDPEFYVIDPESYNRESKKYEIENYYLNYEEEWEKETIKRALTDLAFSSFEYLTYSIKFKDFEYDKEEHLYTAKNIEMIYDETTLPIKEASIGFDNNVLQSIRAVIEAEGEEATYALNTQAIGETTVTLPEVE